MLSLTRRLTVGMLVAAVGACCHSRQVVYTDWERDPTGNTLVARCVSDTTARPNGGDSSPRP